jgi:hypothetical protein
MLITTEVHLDEYLHACISQSYGAPHRRINEDFLKEKCCGSVATRFTPAGESDFENETNRK